MKKKKIIIIILLLIFILFVFLLKTYGIEHLIIIIKRILHI